MGLSDRCATIENVIRRRAIGVMGDGNRGRNGVTGSGRTPRPRRPRRRRPHAHGGHRSRGPRRVRHRLSRIPAARHPAAIRLARRDRADDAHPRQQARAARAARRRRPDDGAASDMERVLRYYLAARAGEPARALDVARAVASGFVKRAFNPARHRPIRPSRTSGSSTSTATARLELLATDMRFGMVLLGRPYQPNVDVRRHRATEQPSPRLHD